jgi:hypothetical protein
VRISALPAALVALGALGALIGTPRVEATVWLQPPAVLPLPSRSGAEGPPRPFGVEPSPGAAAASTGRGSIRAQNRALLFGPFPHGGLVRGVSEGTLLLDESPQVRSLALTRIGDAGATTVRIPVDWRDTVVADPPAGFDARDPSSSAYRFAALDAAVESAAAVGLEPLLVVSHAPAFAEAPDRWPYAYPGSWAPNPVALEEFAAALARRYDGSFVDPLLPGHVLPQVRLFQAWNEPNLGRYLEPQWVAAGGHWSAFSPLLYRELLDGFYTGIKSIQPTGVVVAAGVAPNGEPAGVGRMAPVSFLREMLCLAPAGSSRAAQPPARRSSATTYQSMHCSDPPHFDVLAFHPLSVGDPDLPAASSLDVSISDAGKVTGLLGQAERLGNALPAGPKPVWVTELNWESAPQSSHGVLAARQAAWISRALHRLWIAGVGLVDWQFLSDPYPAVRAGTDTGGTVEYQRPAGLYSAAPGGNFEAARPKAFLRGFTVPFDPLRVNRRHVRVWGLLMHPDQSALLQRLGHAGAWRTVSSLRADSHGVLNLLVALGGTATLRLRSGALISAPALVPRRMSRL